MKQTNGKAKTMRFFAYAVATVVVALMATACGKKDEGGPAVAVVPGVGTSCVGCSPTMTGLIASATARDLYSTAELSLNFYGEAAQVTAAAQNGGYRGSFGASGVFRVRTARPAPCNIPVGDYAVTTSSPGVWDRQGFGNVQLLASGPVQLRLEIPAGLIQIATPAVADWAGATFPYFLVTTRGAYVQPLSTGGYCNAGGYPEYNFVN